MQDGVVAFGFGAPDTIRSNRVIARIASDKALALACSVYTQRDVPIDGKVPTELTDEEPGDPPPTLRIAREAAGWAKVGNFTHLWIVAAEPHLVRAVRDMREALLEIGFFAIVIPCRPEIREYGENDWFCPDSTQERTRSRTSWRMRECVLGHLPFWVYRLVAS